MKTKEQEWIFEYQASPNQFSKEALITQPTHPKTLDINSSQCPMSNLCDNNNNGRDIFMRHKEFRICLSVLTLLLDWGVTGLNSAPLGLIFKFGRSFTMNTNNNIKTQVGAASTCVPFRYDSGVDPGFFFVGGGGQLKKFKKNDVHGHRPRQKLMIFLMFLPIF